MTILDDLIIIVLHLVLPLVLLQVTPPAAVRVQAAVTLPVAVVALPDVLAAVAAVLVEGDNEVKYYHKK